MARSSEPVIFDARVGPGHDGEAVLVVRVEHENGVLGTVTLDARAASKLLTDCRAEGVDGLRGQPWHRLLHVLEQREDGPEEASGGGTLDATGRAGAEVSLRDTAGASFEDSA